MQIETWRQAGSHQLDVGISTGMPEEGSGLAQLRAESGS